MTNPQHPAPQPGFPSGPGQPAGQHTTGQQPAPQPGQYPGQYSAQHPGQQYDPQQAPFGYTQQPGPHGYAQQPGGQPPHPGPPAQAKRKKPLWKRWWFWLLAVIVLIVIISSVGGGGDSAEDAEASADSGSSDESGTGTSGEEEAGGEADGEAPAEAASEYSIGDAVATGDWEVTVNDVESGVSELGDEYLGTTAQGQFILVEMSVANTGSEPSFFFESDVSLLDADGNTYSPDSEAGIYAATDNDVMLLEEINPGNTATGVIVYDVPADVSPNVLEFQGGIFDEAATVALD
ncbi:DUF4352 domain-containing protein [Brevibacterium yomogidense]|uniref:DUF4352 domain-containing protein n=1 Tax=Brevibacterium yomogidense TaxID=946573 RepID=A0A1X6XJ60_9MICO|nr:DUF4352 domain-containing protein [Brevibacterium yomogidense]SLM99019.1 BH3064 unknown [Brevibacterium yomogidense]